MSKYVKEVISDILESIRIIDRIILDFKRADLVVAKKSNIYKARNYLIRILTYYWDKDTVNRMISFNYESSFIPSRVFSKRTLKYLLYSMKALDNFILTIEKETGLTLIDEDKDSNYELIVKTYETIINNLYNSEGITKENSIIREKDWPLQNLILKLLEAPEDQTKEIIKDIIKQITRVMKGYRVKI